MKEKLKDASPKNKTLEKKFLRKEVDILNCELRFNRSCAVRETRKDE